jgi:hypothetical protein
MIALQMAMQSMKKPLRERKMIFFMGMKFDIKDYISDNVRFVKGLGLKTPNLQEYYNPYLYMKNPGHESQ